MSFSHVLFVCTGNICRSPMAEMMWNSTSGLLPASSAGLAAVAGAPIDQRAASGLSSVGVTVGEFTARRFTPGMANGSAVITMTQSQVAKVGSLVPSAYPRTFALNALANLVKLYPDKPLPYLHQRRHQHDSLAPIDIVDPVDCPDEVFDSVASEIHGALAVLKESSLFSVQQEPRSFPRAQ